MPPARAASGGIAAIHSAIHSAIRSALNQQL